MTADSSEEQYFRERYAAELRKMKSTGHLSPHFGIDELSDETYKVARQEMATPGRRGEQIKREEIGKEILRRIEQAKNVDSRGL